MVALLSFGFWAGLLGSGGGGQNGGSGLQYETRYWQPALSKAFPFYSGRRSTLHRDLESVRLFRNRLAHHEPIFGRHLAADHASLLRLAGYISSDAQAYLASQSRVPAVLARRAHAVSTGLGTSF